MNTHDAPDIALKLWVVLTRAFEAVSRLDRESIQSHGLSRGEFSVLEALYHKGPLLLGELRRKVLISSGGTTYLVDRLGEKGLVERRPCADDRRAMYAAVTDRGREFMDRVFPVHAVSLRQALSGLDAGEQLAAIELLKKLGHRADRLAVGLLEEGDVG